MDRSGFEFDLVTQRFLKNRWETDLGQHVYKEVLDGIKRGADVRSVLDRYVLDHSENSDPYGHPYYPVSEMEEGRFWVLTQDDLRGIHFYNEVFPEKAYLGKKDLNYARFYNCVMRGADFEMTNLTCAVFEKCNFEKAVFVMAGGYNSKFTNCFLKDACFIDIALREVDFSGADLRNVYFENVYLENIIVDYNTQADSCLRKRWEDRMLPGEQEPELLKAFRMSYAHAELWYNADKYLYLERVANRKYLLWQKTKDNKSLLSFGVWIKDYFWGFIAGYGVKPNRIWFTGFIVALLFSIVFFVAGNPGNDKDFMTSLYFSFTTFATLGYGDLSYKSPRWIMRLISTAEAWTGAVLISMFVALMARKVLRY
ncbi:MAG: voltage-gated potassium channel [Chlorobaculum sp.]|jgi:hypothetical protein|nr:voltage-gated potassium channel [Chlorobaculum sp.]